jgi:PKD repeat protein
MMKKISYLSFTVCIVLSLLWIAMPSEKEQFAQYVSEHPYNHRTPISKSEIKTMPKHNRPDLVLEREFLLTMNPYLKRPTPEVLLPTIKKVAAYKRAFFAKTLPGSELEQSKWIERGPNDIGGRTRTVMFDPNDASNKRVFAGGVGGGLWYNNDITISDSLWHNISDMWANLAVTAMDYDKSNTNIMYVGTGEGWRNADAIRGLGVWKSIDGGVSWDQLENTTGSDFRTVQSLVVHPVTNALLVGTAEGLFKSTDGGSTFSKIISEFISDITFAANNYMYVGTGNISNPGKIYGSSTDGAPFTGLSGNGLTSSSVVGRIQISTAPSADSVVYVLTCNNGTYDVEGIYRSSNFGASWTKLPMPVWSGGGNFARGQAWYDLVSVVSPVDENVIIVGGVDLLKSIDGGQNWTQISYWNANRVSPNYVHADHHELVYVPGSDSLLLSGSDGGLSITTDIGENWETRNNHYNVTQFYAAGIHPEAGNNTYVSGAQDNGTILVSTPDFENGRSVSGGDGAFCFIDQDEPQYAIVSSQYGNFRRLLNWTYNGSVIGGSTGDFINPGDYDDKENILYSVIANNFSNINRVTNATGSVSRELLSTSGIGGKVAHISVSPNSPAGVSNIFIGTVAGNVGYIQNAQDDALAIRTNLDFEGIGTVSCIDIGRNDQELVVTVSNYGVVSVYYTNNLGQEWVNVEGNLPDMPVRWAMFNPTNRKEVILATEVGIWGTKDIKSDNVLWTPQINGFANVRVDMLQYRTSDYQVLATTHGRGMFTSDAFAILDSVDVQFEANQNYINPARKVVFTNNTSGFANSYEWLFEGAVTTTYSGFDPPAIQYLNAGCYKVTLTATRDGVDFVNEKTCYITVRPSDCEPIFSYNIEPDSIYKTIPPIDSASFEMSFIDNDSNTVAANFISQGYNNSWVGKEINGEFAHVAISRFEPEGKADNWLIFGPLTIPNEQTLLTWKHKLMVTNFRDGYSVYASSAGNTMADFLNKGSLLKKFKDNDPKTLEHNQLTEQEASLPFELLGEQVYFAFRHTAYNMTVIGLDEFGLTTCSEIPAAIPVADFTADSLEIYVNKSVQFTDLSASFPIAWTWDFNGGLGDVNAQNPLVSFDTPGCKKIMLWAQNAEGIDSTSKACYINVMDDTGIESAKLNSTFNVFPNPFNNEVQINGVQIEKISVMDASGRLVYQTNEQQNKVYIDTQNWPSGLYFIEIRSNQNREILKLIKE